MRKIDSEMNFFQIMYADIAARFLTALAMPGCAVNTLSCLTRPTQGNAKGDHTVPLRAIIFAWGACTCVSVSVSSEEVSDNSRSIYTSEGAITSSSSSPLISSPDSQLLIICAACCAEYCFVENIAV